MADPQDKPVNDRREGIIRDPVNWKGQIVSYVKDIGNGDPGYDANIRQVLIMTQDGTEKVVPESEILRDRKVMVEQNVSEPDRRPEHTLPKAVAGLDEGDAERNAQARPAADAKPHPAAATAPQPARAPHAAAPHAPRAAHADATKGGAK